MSAVVKRNVYLDRFRFKQYANIFVFLIGPSGIRKSPAVSFAQRLVEGVRNTHIIAGRSSIQAITKEMGTARTQEGGPMLDEASCFLAAGEFASSLVADPQALLTLTDLYDTHYHRQYKVNLVGREGETLDKPYITALMASNKNNIEDLIQAKEIHGGFVARTFIINAIKKNRKNSLTRPPKVILDEDKLIEYLKEVARLKGEFRWAEGADDMFDAWYHKLDDTKDDPTGSRSRLDTNVLKVAMLLSLTKRLDLTIIPEDITDSLVACADLITDMNRVFMPGKGAETEIGKKVAIVLNELLNAKDNEITRQKLMTKYWGILDAYSIDQVIETLVQPGMVKVRQSGNKAAYIVYKLSPEGRDALLEMEGRISKEGVVEDE